MLKNLLILFISALVGSSAFAGERASDRYQILACGADGISLMNLIEHNLNAHKTAVERRLTLKGFRGATLTKALDITVQCANSTTKSYESNDRVLISAFFELRNNLCRFQFSAESLTGESQVLDFEYIHCALNL